MIRLLLLIPTLDRSGAEKQLTLLATHLPRDQFDVHVAMLTRGGPLETPLREAQIPLHVLGKRFKFDPIALRRLCRLLREVQPDLLHTWLFAANAYGRLAAGRRPRCPVIVSERCVDSWKSGWQLQVDRWLAPRTARLIGNSRSVADFYRQSGFPEERLGVIFNGVDVPEIPEGERARVRAALGLPPGARVIGYVGRLARQKRVKDLIWALELVRLLDQEVVLVIAGDGPERERLEAFARSIDATRRIRFLGARDDAVRLMPAFDLLWLASDFEGQSNSIMEAMAAGTPVVASDIPPNRELVQHGVTGFLAPVGDRVAYAQFAERLLNDDALARQLGQAGRTRIQREFSVGGMVEAYAAMYRQLAGGG